ncbi:hypothetical protein ABW20_dc0106352 [Dactylellina cionopaga]|nr:hypothetical protein ABW20_dc0106352 [Dactylellina cionopaga]
MVKILFIRHGETTDNLRHVYAGITDSSLTSHGVLQTARLAAHLSSAGGSNIPPVTHIFASPLSRAKKTAEAILDEQKRQRKKLKLEKEKGKAETSASAAAVAAAVGNGDTSAAPDVPEAGSSTAPLTENSNGISEHEEDEEDDGDDGIFFKIDIDLIEQDFGSYEGEPFLTATPKKNLKKRKRSDSLSSASAVTAADGGISGDSKKRSRRGEEWEDEGAAQEAIRRPSTSHSSIPTTTTDVEMTAGEEGPLKGISTPSQSATHPSDLEPTKEQGEEEEEEGEEEEFREMETPADIKSRADSFIRRCIIPLLPDTPALTHPATTGSATDESEQPPPLTANPVIAIVSHGMLLSWLWKAFVSLFPTTSVLATTPVVQKGWYQGKHPIWGNTGYLVVEVLPKGVVSKDGMTVVIEGVNEKAHLAGLKRTGGGVGSEKFDERQTKLDGFFGKKA